MSIKICPFCGTENEQDAVNCQLFNLEFELNDNMPEHSAPMEMSAEPERTKETAENYSQTIQSSSYDYVNQLEQSAPAENPLPVTSGFPESITDSGNHNTVLYIIISVLVLIIIAGAIIGFQYFRNQTNQGISASVAESEQETESDTQNATDSATESETEQSETVSDTEESIHQAETIPEIGVLLSSKTGTSNEKIHQDFYQILQDSDAPGGYLYDIDHDGKDEMILKDTYNMQFVLYKHNDSGDLYMYQFGGFLAWGDDDFYDVTGSDGSHYIYYRDEYNQTSAQGYYDLASENRLDIGIRYEGTSSQCQAEWAIFSNDAQVDSGSESVSDVYAQPDKCHTSLMKYLDICGFPIDENSNYSKITMLYYDDLCQKTGGAKAVSETVPVTEAKQPPEISCEIKVQGSEQYEGYSYTLYVNGKYDYYYIECDEYSEGSPNEAYRVFSGNKSDSSLYLTAGSSLDRVTVSVTPYYSDGTKGKTVSCTQSQPAPKVTNVPMPSTCLYMGTGTPVSGDGFLNLRSSKSTSSDSNIITQIPNGASISMYSINDSSWIYVEYGSYSGYVKESYTKLTDPQGLWADEPGDDEADFHDYDDYVDVYSCYAVGEINGTSVSGYATSYVVNGGSKSKVRDRLGDGWHVTAYNYCYSQGHTWYEVYDTDDGDYYGWVSEYCITFYGG